MDTVRDERLQRLQIRVKHADKARLERAAATARVSVSAFVLQAAEARASEVLADRVTISLSPEAAEAFSAALAHPAQVSERLASALRRPRRFKWLD